MVVSHIVLHWPCVVSSWHLTLLSIVECAYYLFLLFFSFSFLLVFLLIYNNLNGTRGFSKVLKFQTLFFIFVFQAVFIFESADHTIEILKTIIFFEVLLTVRSLLFLNFESWMRTIYSPGLNKGSSSTFLKLHRVL